jgi:RNA polymerase sigma factor (TIGR02999 family)
MGEPAQHTVTRLLHELKAGNRQAFAELLPLVYGELHQIAGRHRQRWDGEETLNTTALVHEAYLRLVDQSAPQWQSYPHFLAVASTAMRQILLDYAKRKHATKRGGGHQRVPLHEIEAALKGSGDLSEARSEALLALDDALRRLEQRDRRQSRIVECRFFGGMTIGDTAEALGVAPATVTRGWLMAKAWLYRDLKETLGDSA